MIKKPLDQFLAFHEHTMEQSDRLLKDCPWENPDFYTQWCGQSYYFVAHATRIMSASAARLPLSRDVQHVRFLDHCQEEKHHEKLYEKDLKVLGFKTSDFTEHPFTSFLYQCQYHLVEYADPIAPMGGIFYLEGISVYSGTQLLERCLKAHGKEACQFLKVHVHDDQDHIQKARQILGALDAREMAVVETSYKQFSFAYMELLKLMAAESAQKRQAA